MNQFLTNHVIVLDLEKWEVVKIYDLVGLKLDVTRIVREKYGKYPNGEECMNGITWVTRVENRGS